MHQWYSSSGIYHYLSPDDLFDKFSALTVSLPENAKTWSHQLCSLFLSALTPDLSEHVTTESGLVMPDLNTLTTKALQTEALRVIRLHASKSYETLK